jgi:hypothetical protein
MHEEAVPRDIAGADMISAERLDLEENNKTTSNSISSLSLRTS